MPAGPKLSVVICTYNRREVLVTQALPALFQQDLAVEDFEIIVIVDGSTDGTAEALRRLHPACTFRVVEQKNRGLSASRNTGIEMARAEAVIFIDDDIICRPDVLRRHVEAHRSGEPVVAHGALFLAPETPPSLLANSDRTWYQRYNSQFTEASELPWPTAKFVLSNASAPRQTLLDCGGLDETLPAEDDFELGLRLWKRGIRFQYLPDAVAYELTVKSWRSFLFTDGRAFGKTEVLLSRKYPEHREHSYLLAGMGKTAGWKRLMRRIVLQFPLSPARVVALPIGVCERFCRVPLMQRVGMRLLEIGRRITEFRAALEAVGTWKNFEAEFSRRLPVLLYHHVGPAQAGVAPSLTVTPERFARHVRQLARRGYQGIGAADWLRWRREGKGLPEKPVLITFDDGYADLAEHALPALRQHGFSAVVFVVTGQVGGTNAWDEARGGGRLELMTEQQIRHWASQGIEFGAHSRTHPDLTACTPAEREDEVAGSGRDLEAILGTRPVAFAYPYGFHNQAVRGCVRKEYELAFLADDHEDGLNDLTTDPMRSRRSMVQSYDSSWDLASRARWGSSPVVKLRTRLRLRSRLKSAMVRS